MTFVSLLFFLGVVGGSFWVLERVFQIPALDLVLIYRADYDALLATCGITGISGILSGGVMISMLIERRRASADRRQRDEEIKFPDRRSHRDRRGMHKTR